MTGSAETQGERLGRAPNIDQIAGNRAAVIAALMLSPRRKGATPFDQAAAALMPCPLPMRAAKASQRKPETKIKAAAASAAGRLAEKRRSSFASARSPIKMAAGMKPRRKPPVGPSR